MATRRINTVEGELGDLWKKTFLKFCGNGIIDVDGCILPGQYRRLYEAIENFKVRDEDTWLCSFPKTGTTWAQEMVWCIVNGLDSDRSRVPLTERFPFLEAASVLTREPEGLGDAPGPDGAVDSIVDLITRLTNSPSPRFIKTHLSHDLLPRELRTGEKKPRIVYVCRNPKDTAISYYHFSKLIWNIEGSLEQFCDLFLGDTVIFGPFWKNVLSFWNKRNDYNMIFLKYEDMKKDLPSVIKETATFFGKDLTNDQVSLLTEHLSFSSMKANPAVNRENLVTRYQNALRFKREGAFMRSGKTEQWKTAMTPELIKIFDDWTRENLDGTGLSF